MLNVHVKLTGALADAAALPPGSCRSTSPGTGRRARRRRGPRARRARAARHALHGGVSRGPARAAPRRGARPAPRSRAPEVRLGARVARGTCAFWGECAPSDEPVALSTPARAALRAVRRARARRAPVVRSHRAGAARAAEANLRLFGSAGVGRICTIRPSRWRTRPAPDTVGAAVAALGGAEPAAFRAETVDVGRVGPGGTVLSGEDVASIAVTGSKPATLACMSAQQNEILRLRMDEQSHFTWVDLDPVTMPPHANRSPRARFPARPPGVRGAHAHTPPPRHPLPSTACNLTWLWAAGPAAA